MSAWSRRPSCGQNGSSADRQNERAASATSAHARSGASASRSSAARAAPPLAIGTLAEIAPHAREIRRRHAIELFLRREVARRRGCDTIEEKTGLTPRAFVELARERGFDAGTKATPILQWLAEDYGLGRGHGMALVHVITKGDRISTKHVGSAGSHRDESDRLWLDGKDSKPAGW